MRNTISLFLLLALAAVFAPPAKAQSEPAMAGPPKVLQIIREEVKPGKTFQHSAHEAQWTRAMVNAKFDTPLLALVSATGPNEAWFVAGYDSFAAYEKDGDRMMKNAAMRSIMENNTSKETDYVQDARLILARYRPDLSYRPDFQIGEYRYFNVNTVRVRLGQDVTDFYKQLNDARTQANLDDHFVVYQVISGAPVGTLLAFRPIKSLAAYDEPPNATVQDAMKNLGEMAGKVLLSVEPRTFEFAPAMSSMPPEVVAANPSFWKPKPAPMKAAVVPAAKKEADKK